MNILEVVKQMVEEGYLLEIKGKFRVTEKFYREVTGKNIGIVQSLSGALVVKESASDWRSRYTQFIIEAKVPKQAETSEGGVYDLNKYSENAMKVFKRMLEKEGVRYDVLVISTALYYARHNRMKMTISNYIERGAWRTDYDAMIDNAKSDNVQQYIKDELNDGTFSGYQLG